MCSNRFGRRHQGKVAFYKGTFEFHWARVMSDYITASHLLDWAWAIVSVWHDQLARWPMWFSRLQRKMLHIFHDGSLKQQNPSISSVQVTKATSSVRMEKVWFERCLEILFDAILKATDHPVGIRTLMKKKYPEIEHQFDVWHLAIKAVKKKLHIQTQKWRCKEYPLFFRINLVMHVCVL